MIEITAFHTCKKNGQEYRAPFLSKKDNQWLTQGHYFWTDSDFFAKKWGETHYIRRGRDYCVMKFSLTFERERLLDLVGNVDDKIKFKKLYIRICEKESGKVSLAEAITFMRNIESNVPGAFPYHAIKVEDKRDLDLQSISFTENSKESIDIGPTRQQLCVFKNCYNFDKGEEVKYE